MNTSLLMRSLALLLAAPLAAQTVAHIPASADNTLYENATGAVSNGAGPGLFVGQNSQGARRRAVLRFDVAAALPPAARIVDVALRTNVVQSNGTSPEAVFGHRLTSAFGEGTSSAGPAGPGGGGSGAPSTTGDATWLHTFYPSSLWATPGGDFAATPSFEITLPTSGFFGASLGPTAVADVESWRTQPANNHGWLLKTSENSVSTARKIDSRETPSSQTYLVVTYLMPGQVTGWGTGCTVGSGPFTMGNVGLPIGGNTVTLQLNNAPAQQLGAFLYAFEFDSVGVSIGAACPLHLPLGPGLVTGNLFTASSGGTASTQVAIPVGFQGLLLASQAIALNGSPNGFVLSSPMALCLQ